jgi:UDP-glucose 4-epimerase
MKQTILITGWAGYIWSHAVVAFEKAWYTTVIVDNFINSSYTSLQGIEKILWYKPHFVECDIRNKKKLQEIFQTYNFDWVLHFAWLKAVWESCQKPLEYFDNNISGSLVLFEVMEEFQVKNILFSSSATVYKSKENISWLIETDITGETTNPYGTSKFLLENILNDLSQFAWFSVINLRYFNPIWAHQSGYIWENPNGLPNNLVPYIMKVAIWELDFVSVFGNDYKTIDGTWVRDYIDVIDLIEGHIKAYEYMNIKNTSSKEWFFQVFNLWTGKWVSVLEMIRTIEQITQQKINYQITKRRSWDLAEVYCNPKKAWEQLHWKTHISLCESITNMWKFYQNIKNGKK